MRRRPATVCNVVPDQVDFRDRTYQPSVVKAPPPKLDALGALEGRLGARLPVLDQANSSACTGFALAGVVNYLRRVSGLEPEASASARMLYSMARRYDEFPGSREDAGSSVRGALKGWFLHGAAAAAVWPNDMESMPPPRPEDPASDWWFDAVKRPLGAYYRIEARSISDLHVAIAEVGVVYASSICHQGWAAGFDEKRRPTDGIWEIPCLPAGPTDGGHAFMVYGYDSRGFLLQNSWSTEWGTQGCARVRYEDWLANVMDCWVAQLGVATSEHIEVARAGGIRYKRGRVALSNDDVLRLREISPFVIDMENDGRLSHSGRFRTKKDDIRSLLEDVVARARRDWKLGPKDPVDVAIYAHGGLTTENGAAMTAAGWLPALYEAHIVPIFFFWETGLFKTLENIVEESLRGQPRPTTGLLEKLDEWWDRRLEHLLACPGTAVWNEMKENAESISTNEEGGAKLLYSINERLKPKPLEPRTTRLHLIGHSAGAIVHCHLASQLIEVGWSFETVSFMAPAVRVDVFEKKLLPHLRSGKVARYLQLHLQDDAEQRDRTCRPILGYSKSLLYLVSEACEGGERTPILGMEKWFSEMSERAKSSRIRAYTAAGIKSAVSTHGGFDDDEVVRAFIVRFIREGRKTAVARAPRRAGKQRSARRTGGA